MKPELRNLLSLCTRESRDRVLAVDEIASRLGFKSEFSKFTSHFVITWAYDRNKHLYFYHWQVKDHTIWGGRHTELPGSYESSYIRMFTPAEVERVCRFVRGDVP